MICQIVSEFLLLHSRLKHGRQYLCAKSKTSPRKTAVHSYRELFSHYHLKGVREDSQLGLLGWLRGDYRLEARLDLPTPREMLEVQCQGRRIVTLLLKPEQQFTPIGRHAGAYEFLLHDLEHAHKFFGGEFHGQVRFFRLLRKALDHGLLQDLLGPQLDYLMADMNSHPVHMLKYLKAIALNGLGGTDRQLAFWSQALFEFWQLPPSVHQAALRINYPQLETLEDRYQVAEFFLGAPA